MLFTYYVDMKEKDIREGRKKEKEMEFIIITQHPKRITPPPPQKYFWTTTSYIPHHSKSLLQNESDQDGSASTLVKLSKNKR